MNIWLLQTGEPLPLSSDVRKMRTALLAEKLLERGHSVRWWASAFEHQRKVMLFDADCECNLQNGLTLQILCGCGYKKNLSFSRYIDHRIIAAKFRNLAPHAEPPDVIVASMPCHHLAYEAVHYSRKRKIPVLVDVRDLWPDTFAEFLHIPVLKALGRAMLYQDFNRLSSLLGGCDGILAVSKTMLEWALGKTGRPRGPWDRVFYIGYKKASVPDTDAPPEWLQRIEGKKIVAYVGTFGLSYELELILKAARRFHESGREDVCFILAGIGQQERALRSKADTLPNVILPGWISASEIQLLLKRAAFGLVPCRSVKGVLPNKVFEYFSAGLPVISSLQGEMADAISRFHLGFNYTPGDLEGICEAMRNLLENPSLREKMAFNASIYFHNCGDAGRIYIDYANHIENLVIAGTAKRGINPSK